MIKFVFYKILLLIPVLLGVSTLTFMLIHLVPGDPVELMLGDQASSIDREVLRKTLGLDKPLSQQYFEFLGRVVQGNLGESLTTQQPVLQELALRIPATFELAIVSLILTLAIALPLGIIAAVYKDTSIDRLASLLGLIGMSVPNFWLGPILILIFSIWLGVLPVSDRGGFLHLILPSLSLATSLSAIVLRMTRASMLEVLNEDYIRSARAKGLSPKTVYAKHALRNALMPIITIIGLQLGALLTGTVITETIFDWPGIGTFLFQGIQQRDYPVVQACVIFIASIYVIINALTDIAYAVVNPRIVIK